MSDERRTDGESGESRQRWMKEAQEALDRTGDAVRTAWEATRESRMSALESAKQAVKELGEVLEHGLDAAKERWGAEGADADTTATRHAESSSETSTSEPPLSTQPSSTPPPRDSAPDVPDEDPDRP